ncbi:MAG: penicillin-binding protein 2 [marine benthic group bacterium]|nr:penicillin-binding protein 2 [Candidatus Benthicola marisminoris]
MTGGEEVRLSRARRARAAAVVLVTVTLVLVGAFFRLQVLGGGTYELQSRNNRLRPIPIPAARGAIYDRNDELLAESIPGYSLSLLPAPPDSAHATLQRLAPYLRMDSSSIEAILERRARNPQLPVLVRDDLTFEQVAAVEERRPEFRLVVIGTHPRRRYPAGSVAAHVIGYVGEISEQELDSDEFVEYEAGRVVGKQGIERTYESLLAGSAGTRYVEVNARGSIVREFPSDLARSAEPGTDLKLTLDLELQQFADSIFPEGDVGGAVALDPRNGEVLLLYSHPTFDPNLFVGGISTEDWEAIRDDPGQPILNRATAALYPPGSTWKLVLAALAMRSGAAGIETYMPTSCRGALQYGRRPFRCWRPEGHGPLTMSGAIMESCNVYFYQLGLRIGLDPLLAGVDGLGFNSVTGLDIPGEVSSRFPPSRDWYDRRFGRRGWTESVILNLSIGQGETEQTLIRMAQFYSALATGQSPVVPHLLQSELLERVREGWSLDLPEARRLELIEGLKRVVNEPGGTAYWHRPQEWTLAGKTGTSQNPHGEPHSWFVGFAPADDPRIVIAAIVENGHPDNQTSRAVPFASQVVSRYLRNAGVPPDNPLEDAGGPVSATLTGGGP